MFMTKKIVLNVYIFNVCTDYFYKGSLKSIIIMFMTKKTVYHYFFDT